MEESILNDLKGILERLKDIDSSFICNNLSTHYIEFFAQNSDDAILAANTEGLIHIAVSLLDLAIKQTPDTHYHFDENSMLDNCDKGLILSFKKEDW